MRYLPASVVLSFLCPAGALRAVGRFGAAPALDVDPTFGTDASAHTKFFFLTHHKTGTNLMQQLCNLTARFLSNGTEQCHWCYKVQGVLPDGGLKCPYDDCVEHGTFRGTAGRFTLISAVDDVELRRLEQWAPDYRAVHMIRDPVDMLVSDYQYEVRLHQKHSKFDWDATTSQELWGPGFTIQDRLRNVSGVLSHFVDHMCRVQSAIRGNPRVKTMNLQSFTDNFNAAAKQLFRFMVGSSYPGMDQLLKQVSRYDKSKQKNQESQLHVSNSSAAPAIKSVVLEMVAAKDEMILASTSCPGAEVARPWARKLVHFGNAKRNVTRASR